MLAITPPAGHPLPPGGVLRAATASGGAAGPAFAEHLAASTGARAVVLTQSGTGALELACRTALAKTGRRRIVLPAYTCPQVLTAVLAAGGEACACRVSADGTALDLDHLAGLVGKAAAVISVSLCGLPTNTGAVHEQCRATGALHIEDAAQAFGRVTGGMAAGLQGDLGIWSFGRGKPLSVLHGGAVAVPEAGPAPVGTDDMGPAEGMPKRLAVTLAYALTYSRAGYGLLSRVPGLGLGDTRFTRTAGVRAMAPYAAALADSLLDRFAAWQAARATRTAAYAAALGSLRERGWGVPAFAKFAPLNRFPLVAPDGAARDAAVARLRRRGVGATVLYPWALTAHPSTRAFVDVSGATFPHAEGLGPRLLTLPTHAGTTDADVARAVAVLTAPA